MQDKFQDPERDRRSDRPNLTSRPSSHQGHRSELNAKDDVRRVDDDVTTFKNTRDGSTTDRRPRSSYSEPNSKEERDWRNEKRSRHYEPEPHLREDKYSREKDRRSGHDRETSRHHHRREKDERDR